MILINRGYVRLHALQLTIPQLQGNTSSGSMTCVTGNGGSWPADSDLAAAEQLTCNGSFTFDQAALEAGDVVPKAAATAGTNVQAEQTLPTIEVLNQRSLAVSVDSGSCTKPSTAGAATS